MKRGDRIRFFDYETDRFMYGHVVSPGPHNTLVRLDHGESRILWNWLFSVVKEAV